MDKPTWKFQPEVLQLCPPPHPCHPKHHYLQALNATAIVISTIISGLSQSVNTTFGCQTTFNVTLSLNFIISVHRTKWPSPISLPIFLGPKEAQLARGGENGVKRDPPRGIDLTSLHRKWDRNRAGVLSISLTWLTMKSRQAILAQSEGGRQRKFKGGEGEACGGGPQDPPGYRKQPTKGAGIRVCQAKLGHPVPSLAQTK